MNYIENYFEPLRLWLIWRASDVDGTGQTRARRKVAEIVKTSDEAVELRYLIGTEDYEAALVDGFQGFTAFSLNSAVHINNVLEAFIRRLPPRKREDFKTYLSMHRLPSSFEGSDMALLGYTGAKLPGDSFELIPDFSEAELPIDFIIEVAGFRYHNQSANQITIQDEVDFVQEPENEFDSNAIAVHVRGKKIGHVPRPLLDSFHKWLERHQVTATVERINGKVDRPLIYLFVKVI